MYFDNEIIFSSNSRIVEYSLLSPGFSSLRNEEISKFLISDSERIFGPSSSKNGDFALFKSKNGDLIELIELASERLNERDLSFDSLKTLSWPIWLEIWSFEMDIFAINEVMQFDFFVFFKVLNKVKSSSGAFALPPLLSVNISVFNPENHVMCFLWFLIFFLIFQKNFSLEFCK